MWSSTYPPIAPEPRTLTSVVADGADLSSGPALVSADRDQEIDHATLGARAGAIAGALAARGFGRGDVLALWAPNIPGWCTTALGALRAGGVVTAINPAYTHEEVLRQVRDAGACVIVTIPALVPAALEVAREAGVREVLSLGTAAGVTAVADLLGHAPIEDRSQPEELALLPYSSGTTGLPKGVMLTHANLAAAVQQVQRCLHLRPDDRVLALAPFFHIMGFVISLAAPLAAGASVVTVPKFDFMSLLDTLEEKRVTVAVLPPPVVAALASHPAVEGRDLTSIEMIAAGGAALAPHVHRAVAARLPGAVVGQGYGMTETAVGITGPDRTHGGLPGSVGRVMASTELRIVDPEDGADLEAGEDGELWARGPQMMAGYLNRPDATAEILDDDGWIRTGDIGHINADGNVFIVDRLKELIKVNGFQVAPAELEQLLVEHPEIIDAAVVGVADERTGEAPVAFVVAHDGADPQEVMGWLAERVAPYKRLRDLRVVAELPRTPSGKLLRRRLAAEVPAPA